MPLVWAWGCTNDYCCAGGYCFHQLDIVARRPHAQDFTS
jgi:hypothetical protein